jgi:hypothetical protein
MKVNGEVIHNSRAIENYMESESLYYVSEKEKKHYYAITTVWPGSSVIIKNIKPQKGAKVKMLGFSEILEWNDLGEEGTEILIPESLQEEDNRPCDYAWVFKMKGEEVGLVE